MAGVAEEEPRAVDELCVVKGVAAEAPRTQGAVITGVATEEPRAEDEQREGVGWLGVVKICPHSLQRIVVMMLIEDGHSAIWLC
jgi:hypothetical protein